MHTEFPDDPDVGMVESTNAASIESAFAGQQKENMNDQKQLTLTITLTDTEEGVRLHFKSAGFVESTIRLKEQAVHIQDLIMSTMKKP